MKKNLKVLSTLALAGMLTTSVMGTSLATTKDVTSTVPGIYSNTLISGIKNVLPVILANSDDIATMKDIINSGLFDKTLFQGLDENKQLRSGDIFKVGGKEYTVVIFGDVDKNGTVNVLDALEIAKYAKGLASKLDGDTMASVLANVKRADGSGVNILDALRIQRFVLGQLGQEDIIDEIPEKDSEVNYNYELTINDNGYINSENIDKTTVGIKVSQTSEEETTLAVKVLDSNGAEITIAGLSGTTKISAHTDYKAIENIDFSGVSDGTIMIQLRNEKDVIVGTVTTEINTVLPEAALVRTERTSTSEATMSFSAMGNSDIVKMYYVVVKSTDSAPTWDVAKSEFTGLTTKTMKIDGSKLENALISNELTTKLAYKVYYVLENSYGSKSDDVADATILSDTINSQMAKVKTVTIPKIEEGLTEFTWEAPDKNVGGYIVTVYKDGKIVKEEEVANSVTEYDVTMTEAGKYKISVIAKGDGSTTKNSESTMSAEVEVKALKEVIDITFEINENSKEILSWKDANVIKDVKEYQVKLYELKADGTYNTTPAKSYTSTETKQEIDDITANTVYKAEIVVVAKDNQVALVNSEEATLEGFYKIEANPTLGDVTEDSVSLTLADIKINGKSATYQVKIYNVRKGNNPEQPLYTLTSTKNVEFKDGKILINGLESNKTYVFKLIANVDGIQGESDYITGATTLSKTPEIKNLMVVKAEEEAKTGTIYKNGNTLIVNGQTIDLTSNYSEEFKEMAKVIDTLHAKDIVSIKGENVTLKLPSEASSTPLNFGTAVKGMTIVIEGNGFEKAIATTAGSEPVEVTLKGANARFNVDGLNAEKVVLTNGVIVTGNTEYTVSAGATTIINGVKVTTQKETVINANDKELDVTANKETNNLVFENLIADNITEEEATIKFVGSADLTSKQLGTITIKTTGGKVTVAQQNVNVSSTLNVEVNTGEVIIQNEAFTGNKNITVTNKEEGTTTVNAVAKEEAPVAMTNIELKEYTDDEFATVFAGVTNAEEIATIKAYINSFKINGKGAKITVAKGSSNVKIVFEEAVQNVVISNIK